jgi:aminomethyltransferase
MRTALYQEHLNLKAKIVDFAGFEMPIQYSSVKEEVLKVRHHVGMFDVSHMGEFFVTGNQAEDYIDHLVTNDIKAAPWGKAIYSPLCRPDGTIIDDLIVYKLKPGRILICVNASNIKKDFDWMMANKGQFDIELTNSSELFSLIALQGPLAESILLKIYPDMPKLDYYSAIELKDIILARTGYTGEDGFEIFSNHETIKDLWHQFLKHGVVPCGLASRDVLRLEVCYPLYGHELTDEVTPLDSNLNWTVKMNKKSFIGKDFLTTYKPKYKLVKFICEKAIPRDGYKIFNQHHLEVGQVVSGTMSVTLNSGIAQARIASHLYEADDQFFVEIRQNKWPLKMITKPFVSGGLKK